MTQNFLHTFHHATSIPRWLTAPGLEPMRLAGQSICSPNLTPTWGASDLSPHPVLPCLALARPMQLHQARMGWHAERRALYRTCAVRVQVPLIAVRVHIGRIARQMQGSRDVIAAPLRRAPPPSAHQKPASQSWTRAIGFDSSTEPSRIEPFPILPSIGARDIILSFFSSDPPCRPSSCTPSLPLKAALIRPAGSEC